VWCLLAPRRAGPCDCFVIDLDLETAESLSTDVLVIGGGAAGLRAAIEASRRGVDVTLLSESPVGLRNNSAISAGLLAGSGVGEEPGDSAQLHVLDSMDAGRFINDPGMLALMAEGASRQVRDLTEFGVEFRRRAGGELLLTQLPGHSHARHVAGARFRGIDLTVPMRDHAIGAGVRFIEGFLVTGLLRVGDVVAGALAVGRGRLLLVQAASTILATGGAGQLYLRTNNSLGMTGDGYALAYRAGAVLRDMEFVQFYPTAWGRNGGKMCFYERFLPVGAVL